jgi:hypothetical protein
MGKEWNGAMSIYRKRWQYWPPWETTDWWRPNGMFGSDEYGNPSLLLIIPPFGAFVVFYRARIDRSEEALQREEAKFQAEMNREKQ